MQLVTFWSFSPITYIERLCLASMLEAGHPVDLYAYDEISDLPAGVRMRDAREVMPESSVLFYKNGSPALTSNFFRYAVQRRGLGTWIDADVLLLRSLAGLGDTIFGWEDDAKINIAVLRLPPDSPFLDYAERLRAARVPLPLQWSTGKKLRQIARGLVGRQRRLDDLLWGTTGPATFTAFARRHGWLPLAQPVEVFYPVHYREARILSDPQVTVEERFTDRTRAVHLWNSQIDKRKPPAPGSFLARMCDRFGVASDR